MKLLKICTVLAGFTLLPMVSEAATWCGATEIQDVICYSDKSCYVTANAYGGVRYYRIASNDENRTSMIAIALSVFTSKGKARLVFAPDGLSCSNIPQETVLYGVGATSFQ